MENPGKIIFPGKSWKCHQINVKKLKVMEKVYEVMKIYLKVKNYNVLKLVG